MCHCGALQRVQTFRLIWREGHYDSSWVYGIEYLDRLSRNVDWHQGFLLDEMKEYHLQVVSRKDFSSRIERAVIGAISQECMEQAKQRMAEENIYKAKDNRVTARVPAFGYLLVDRNGQVSPEAKTASVISHSL